MTGSRTVMSRLLCFALVLISTLARTQSATTPEARPLLLTHVTVIDGTGAPAKPDMDVVIRDHKIVEVAAAGKAHLPTGVEVVDAAGKFLIPGLWDMHVHTGRRDVFLPLYIANGITGVRDMGGDVEESPGDLSTRYVQLRLWREAIAQGTLLGPRIELAGFLIDGYPWPGDIPAADATEGRQAVDVLKELGVDFIKVKSFLPRDAYFAIASEARAQRMVLAGHVPNTVRAAEAADAGQKSIEHLTQVAMGCSSAERELIDEREKAFAARDRARYARAELRAVETFDNAIASALFAKFVENGTWQVPTLVELRRNALGDSATNNPRWKYLPAPLRERWIKERSTNGSDGAQQLLAGALSLTQRMHEAGVLFMAGTDSANPSIVPGFSLHDELKLLLRAGFTPMEALQTATLNPARYLDRDKQLGTIEVGKLADLVLLDASPLDDISNTEKIRAVIVNGRYLSRGELDTILSNVETAVK